MNLRYDNCPHCFAGLNHADICPKCKFRISNVTENPNVLPPFTLLKNRYLLGHVLGQGGFGITYIAQDIQTGRRCAVKEYMPVEYARRSKDGVRVTLNGESSDKVYEHGKERFLGEAKTLCALLANPIVVRIWDYFEQNNTGYIVMEYLDGVNLREEMNRMGGRVDADYAKAILVTVASSLIEIHRKNILHRDLSPENIFLTKTGDIKLIDFGTARDYVSAQKKNGLSVLLKIGYAPPEQYDRFGEQGPWTDVYSLAATYYFVVSGQKVPSVDFRQKGMKYPPLHEVNPSVSLQTSRVIDKALELKVNRRYQDFKSFMNDLDIQYVQEKSGKSAPKPVSPGGYTQRSTGSQGYTQEPTVLTNGQEVTGRPQEPVEKEPTGQQGLHVKWPWQRMRKGSAVPVVKVISGRKQGIRLELAENEIYKIGRSPKQCHLALEYDVNISRTHCVIRYSKNKGGFVIRDESNNGVFLANGERLEKGRSYQLRKGDRFYLVSKDNMLMVDMEYR